jgi:malonyl-CoA/methylmalonyl-CoA synthetase
VNLHDLFAIPLHRAPTRVALQYADATGSRTLTYRELFGQAERLAHLFHSWGIEKGDRVAVFCGNRPEFVTVYLALLRIGAVLVPINLAYRRREIAHMLADAAPRLLVVERDLVAVVAELDSAERASVERVVAVEDLATEEVRARDALPRVDGDDLAMLLYTSGTTGTSKGAMITHDNVLATVTGLLAAWAWSERDVLLLTLPLFHTHGLVVGLTTALAAGARVLLRRKFEAVRTAADLGSGVPTLFFGVPTMYVRLVDELARRGAAGERPDLARMRLFCSGSAPLSTETFAAFRELAGHEILERYGMTETGMNLSNLYAGPRRPGTVGVPLPGVSIRIVDAAGRDVAAGHEGELLVRGANVFSGYWQAPEKTAASFVTDASGRRWFKTGDLARQDPNDGSVTLLGRASELIISGGFNIYPREIEEALVCFPGVREAAVVGVPHAEWGETTVAYLVCDGPVDDGELCAYLKGQIAAFKVPRELRRCESLPRNSLGKLQKHLL